MSAQGRAALFSGVDASLECCIRNAIVKNHGDQGWVCGVKFEWLEASSGVSPKAGPRGSESLLSRTVNIDGVTVVWVVGPQHLLGMPIGQSKVAGHDHCPRLQL